MPRLSPVLGLATAILGLALTGCGSSGGSGTTAGAAELPGIEKTTVSAGAADRFAASSWGFPTTGTTWTRDTEDEVRNGVVKHEIEYRERTSAPGTPAGSSVAGVVTTTEIYDPEGDHLRTSHGAWTIGDNGIVYLWSPLLATWFPFAPAAVTAGQRWRMPMDGNVSSALQAEAVVASVDATSPNGHTGCIRLEITGRLKEPITGDTFTVSRTDLDQTWWVKPGLGSVYRQVRTVSEAVVNGTPYSEDERHVLELLAEEPEFLPTAIN